MSPRSPKTMLDIGRGQCKKADLQAVIYIVITRQCKKGNSAQGSNVSISDPEVSERDLRSLFVVHVRAGRKLKRRRLLEPWHILKRT